jgi:hypothetical protein
VQLLTLIVALTLLVVSRIASADPAIDVELRYDSDAAPDYVCLSHYRTRLPEQKYRRDDVAACAFRDQIEGKTVPPDSVAGDKCPNTSMSTTVAASAEVFRSTLPGLDGCKAHECSPRVPILLQHGDPTPYLFCVPGKSGLPAPKARVVVVYLDFAGLAPELRFINFKDHVLSVYYATGFDPDRVVTASVLGGSYSSPVASSASRGVLRLDLSPLERQVEIVLPPIAVTSATLSLWKRGDFVTAFTRDSARTVSFPFADPRALRVKVATATGNSELVVASFDRDRISFQPTSFTFAWRKSCHHPAISDFHLCPKVQSTVATCDPQSIETRSLAGNGTVAETFCHYKCDSKLGDAPIPIPLVARFEAQGVQAVWDEEVPGVGAELRGWIDPRDRFVTVNLSGWRDPPLIEDADLKKLVGRAGDSISAIEITRPDGTIARVVPQKVLQRVAIPGIECADESAYRIVGDRSYAVDSVPLVEGEYKLPAPSSTGRYLAFELSLGVGLVRGWGGAYVGGSTIKPNVWRPYGLFQGTMSIQPNPWTVRIEVGAVVVVERRPFFPLVWEQSAESPTTREPRSRWYDRVLVSAGAAFPISFLHTPDGYVYLAGHALFGMGFALYDDEGNLLGDEAWEPGFDVAVRVPVGRYLSLDVGHRWLFHSPFYYFEAGDLRGGAVRRSAGGAWSGFDISLRGRL